MTKFLALMTLILCGCGASIDAEDPIDAGDPLDGAAPSEEPSNCDSNRIWIADTNNHQPGLWAGNEISCQIVGKLVNGLTRWTCHQICP